MMTTTNRACVLLSTYNGEKYLSTQIDSILAQNNVDLMLSIRDDGSTDSTRMIITEYVKKYPNIEATFGTQFGVGKSFMSLLYNSKPADYYAFSDQDDYWYPDKLESAITMIEAEHNSLMPILYCCNQNCVDSERKQTTIRFPKEYKIPSLITNLLGNFISGCTMVMNNALRDLLLQEQNRLESDFFCWKIHDAWIACVTLAVGKVLFDPIPHMDFRRHHGAFSEEYVPGQNTRSIVSRYIGKINRLLKRMRQRKKTKRIQGVKRTVNNLKLLYGLKLDSITNHELDLIANYDVSVADKIRLLSSGIIKKYALCNNTIIYMRIFLNRL